MTSHLYVTVFFFWTPYLVFATFCYLIICYILTKWVATSVSQPLVELSERIKLNVKTMKAVRENKKSNNFGSDNHGRLGTMNQLQVDLLAGFKERNKEMNNLFFSFNAMAKILFMGS